MSNIVRIDDYDGTPRFYDLGTKNASFLLTAKELKELGVKKWYQCLEVKYPNLGVQDLNPYDPNISAEDIGKILVECKQNPWFFFREVLHIPVRGAGSVPLYLHRAGHAAIWCWMNSIDFELVQPRQTYKTTVITGIMAYAMLFEYRNCDIPYMHKTETRCTDNVGILRDYITALPKYLNPWATAKHPPGLQSMKYEAHNVSIAVVSAAKSESVATDKMRGYSLFTAFFDECEFIPFMKSVIDGANPTIVQARITAKQEGLRASMMYASTPGDLETDAGKEWQKILDNLPPFDEKLYYDLSREELERLKSIPKAGEADQDRKPITMLYIEFNYIQLRKDITYLKQQYNEAVTKSTLGEYRRGVLLQRFRGSEGSFFQQEDLDYIQQHMREPDYDIFLMKKYHLYVYKHNITVPDLTSETPYFDMSIPYLIGIDCSTGKGGDNNAICILHPYTLEVVGELQSSVMGILDLMRVVVILAKMLPRALFCLETNATGVDIVDFVQETQLESRFYQDPRSAELTKNVTNPQDTEFKLKQRAQAKKNFGTYVTTNTRKIMFNSLREIVHDYRHLVYSKFLVKDIANLVLQKNGNMAAASGEHDDMCMAYLHTIHVLKYGFKLERFGINKNKCTYSKAGEIMEEFEKSVIEDHVDNTAGLDPNSYEAQLLHDLTHQIQDEYGNPGGYDDYGYKHDQYNQHNSLQETPVVRSTAANLNFFREANNYGLGGYDPANDYMNSYTGINSGYNNGGFGGFGLY